MQSYSSEYTGSNPNLFENNLVYSSRTDPGSPGGGIGTSDYNLWYTTAGSWSNSEAHSVFADPKITNPSFSGSGPLGSNFTLLSGSPAVDAGSALGSMGSRDYYGNTVPQGNGYDIGADESPYTGSGSQTSSALLSNPGFESGSAGWSEFGSAAVVSSGARTGSSAAAISGSSSGVYRTVSGLSPNTTYTFTGWAQAASSGQQGYFYAKSFGGSEQRSRTLTSLTYTEGAVIFTTGSSSTSSEIGFWRDGGSGSGTIAVDDTALAPDLLQNPGFESGLTGWSGTATTTTTNPRSGTTAAEINGSSTGVYRVLTGLKANTTYSLSGWSSPADSSELGYLYAKSFGGTELHATIPAANGYGQSVLSFTTGASSTSVEIGFWRDAGSGTGAVDLDDMSVSEG